MWIFYLKGSRYNVDVITSNTFLWHDYETFGANPRSDRPCQFAALRTNEALEPIEPPTLLYCQPAVDTLPHPMACLITGITPQYAMAHGEPEPKFAQQIFDIMSRSGTCVVGYNNFRFDDEVTRHLFWRNFLSPYSREYSNGNSRFDLINLLRLTRALRPEGMVWPNYDSGQPSFRLEDIAKSNGLDTDGAHDALVDVQNTLAIAKLVFEKQPKLWAWGMKLREKSIIDGLLSEGEPLLMASAFFANRPEPISMVLPLARHPKFSNQWLAWDLMEDPSFWINQSPEMIEQALLGRPTDDEGDPPQRLPIVSIKTNQAPMLAPMSVWNPDTHTRLELDAGLAQKHQEMLSQHPDWVREVTRAFSERSFGQEGPIDPEADLYGGFIPRQDQSLVERIPSLEGKALSGLEGAFNDPRLNTLLMRYRARYYPDTLNSEEHATWMADCHARRVEGRSGAGLTLAEYHAAIEAFAQEHPDRTDLVDALKAWAETAC